MDRTTLSALHRGIDSGESELRMDKGIIVNENSETELFRILILNIPYSRKRLLAIFARPLCIQAGKEFTGFSGTQPDVALRHARTGGHPVL